MAHLYSKMRPTVLPDGVNRNRYREACVTEETTTWRFPGTFWIANAMELFERAAYYGCFIFLTVYLTQRVGFTDIETGYVTGAFSFLLYFMPTIMGVVADRIGFKASICLAFGLLAVGYGVLGAFPTKPAALLALLIILLGGAIVKPVISGTVAKCSDETNRARAFSIFYWVVNIGAFGGKTVVDPIRQAFENPDVPGSGLQYINFYSASMALVALVFAVFFYKNVEGERQEERTIGEILGGLVTVLKNWRFLSLIIITGLFWSIQGQLYATMPKYLFRMVGEFTKPGWIANVNPFVVVLCVIPITHLVRKIRPVSSIGIAFLLIPLAALAVAIAPHFGSDPIDLGLMSMHPIVLLMIVGIVFQGLAECFLSPRYLEFASRQAPPGETGLYMGYSHLNAGFGWFFGFILSGVLLDRWCPDPATLPAGLSDADRALHYAHAHYIWYVFTGIGVLGFVLLISFRFFTDWIDRKAQTAGTEDGS
jgi:dipeptide/tripeptide permease